MRIKIFYIIIILVCVACLKEQPNNGNKLFEGNLVVHAYVTGDSATQIWVGNSTGILQKDTPNTSCNLYLQTKNGTLWPLNQINPGYYTDNSANLKPGDSFKLLCFSSIKSFEIKETVPYKPKVISIDTLHRINPLVGSTLNVDFAIKDTAAIKNFYRVYIYKKYYQYIYDYKGVLLDSFVANKRIPVYGQALPFAQNDYNKYTTDEILFNDATFNGVKQNLSIYTNDLLKPNKTENPLEISVIVETLSENLYNFYNARNAHIWQQKSIIQAPSKVNGNDKDVLGVVGAYSQVHFTYNLKK